MASLQVGPLLTGSQGACRAPPFQALPHCSLPGARAGQLGAGAAYRVLLEGEDGQALPPRRDPYARHTDYDSAWCYVDDAAAFAWRSPWQPPPFDEYLIYEARPPTSLCVARAATRKLTCKFLPGPACSCAW